MALSTGFVLNNRYRIVKLLGQGGFGAVYRAWDTSLSRPCAVKENLEMAPVSQRQFSLEASTLANLNHPNLPRVTDHFILPTGQYLVMDFIDGEDLGTRLQNGGKVGWQQARPWIEQITSAVVYLHSQPNPVIHRDIKPSNIRITTDGRAFLVDFGLVKFYDPQSRTTQGARAVTPGYSPPEQYGQAITDARTDIYALGATIYSLLTAIEPPESVTRLVSDTLLPVRRVDPNIPPAVEMALQKAMQIRPTDRFASVIDFARALSGSHPPPQGSVHVAPPGRMQQAGVPYTPPGYPQPPVPAQKKSGFPWVGCLLVGLLVAGVALLAGLGVTAMQQTNRQNTAVAAVWRGTATAEFWDSVRLTDEAAGFQQTATAERWNSMRMTDAAAAAESASRQETALAAVMETASAYDSLFPIDATIDALGGSGGPIFGPKSGSLALIENRSVLEYSKLSIENFVAEVTFSNPYDRSLKNWDYGIFFRDQADVRQYRLVIASNDQWSLIYQTNSDTGTITESGGLTSLNHGDGAQNTLTLMCIDEQGWLYLNNQYITELDLSLLTGAGDVSVASGIYTGNQIAGEITDYHNFTVWQLP